VEEIRQFFLSGRQVELLPFTAEVADRYSSVRATTPASPADAIHLACAALAGVDLFITHDKKLHRLAIPGIQFITGLDGRLFPG
jgi:predicted nucleic acid-binding protein